MQPALLIIILARKTQVLTNIASLNNSFPKRLINRRPHHVLRPVRELLRGSQMVIVVVVQLTRTAKRQRLTPQIQVFHPRLAQRVRLGQQATIQVIVVIGETGAHLFDPLAQRVVTVRPQPLARARPPHLRQTPMRPVAVGLTSVFGDVASHTSRSPHATATRAARSRPYNGSVGHPGQVVSGIIGVGGLASLGVNAVLEED